MLESDWRAKLIGTIPMRPMQVTTKFLIVSAVLWMAAILVWRIKDQAEEAARIRSGAEESALAPRSNGPPASWPAAPGDGWWADGDGPFPAIPGEHAMHLDPPPCEGKPGVQGRPAGRAGEFGWVR